MARNGILSASLGINKRRTRKWEPDYNLQVIQDREIIAAVAERLKW
jgi:hypothetical protein